MGSLDEAIARANLGGAKPKAAGHSQGLIPKALSTILGSKPIAAALDVIDTPRAAVVSTLKETADALGGDGFSPRDLVSQTRRNIGAGELVANADLPINVKRALGFVGDVAFDPTTYLSGGASVAAKGATSGLREGTRLGLKEAADVALDAGRRDLAESILKNRTAAFLGDADKQALGLETRMRFGIGKHKVAIPHTDGVARLRATLTNPVFDKVGDSKLATTVGRITDPISKTMADLRRHQPAVARQVERAERLTRHEGEGFRTTADRELDAIYRGGGRDADRATVRQAIEDPTFREALPAGSLERTTADALAAHLEDVAQRYEKATGKEIARLDNYLPHQMTSEFKAALEDTGRRTTTNARAGFEMTRQNRIGSQWFGVELKTGSIEEMEQIAKDALGDKYRQIFKDDPWEIVQSYHRGLSRKVADHRFDAELTARGVVEHVDEARLVKDERRTRRATKIADRAEGAVRSAQQAAADVRQRQGDVAAKAASAAETKAAAAAATRARNSVREVDKLSGQASDLAEFGASVPPSVAVEPTDVGAARRSELEQAIQKAGVDRTALEGQRNELTTAASQANRSADLDLAKIRRELSPGDFFKSSKAADVLRGTGDEALGSVADRLAQLDPRLDDRAVRGLVGEARQRLDQMAEERLADQRAFRNTVNVADLPTNTGEQGARLAFDEGTVRGVGEIDKALGDVERQGAAHVAELGQLQDSFDQARAASASNADTFDAQVQADLAELTTKIEKATESQRVALQEQQAHLTKAQQLAAAARQQPDPRLAEVARLEAVAEKHMARERVNLDRAIGAHGLVRELGTAERRTAFERMQLEGLTAHIANDPTAWANPETAKALKEFMERSAPKEVGAFLKTHDALLARWKAYSLLSPGFHIRNWLGGRWNNWMAGVDHGTARKFARATYHHWKGGADAVGKAMGPEWQHIFEEADRLSIWGHNVPDLADVDMTSRSGLGRRIADKLGVQSGPGLDRFDPTSLDNAALKLNLSAGEKVERQLRGELFADRILKGFSSEAALEDVIKYHFDYAELSHVEGTVLKRLVPFYTWTRKNFPLQIGNFIANPAKFNHWTAAKRNLELGTPKDAVVPAYFDRLMGVRTPFDTNGGSPIYVTPDLPITRLGETITPKAALESVSPLLKLPIEVSTNHSFFTDRPLISKGEGAQPIPTAFKPLAPLFAALGGVAGMPKVERSADGAYLMDRLEAYKVEQALPLLGRLRRLFPNEKRYQDRVVTTWLSTLAGVSGRTLTPDEIAQELAARK